MTSDPNGDENSRDLARSGELLAMGFGVNNLNQSLWERKARIHGTVLSDPVSTESEACWCDIETEVQYAY
jgi:hypothetical protein